MDFENFREDFVEKFDQVGTWIDEHKKLILAGAGVAGTYILGSAVYNKGYDRGYDKGFSDSDRSLSRMVFKADKETWLKVSDIIEQNAKMNKNSK